MRINLFSMFGNKTIKKNLFKLILISLSFYYCCFSTDTQFENPICGEIE